MDWKAISFLALVVVTVLLAMKCCDVRLDKDNNISDAMPTINAISSLGDD